MPYKYKGNYYAFKKFRNTAQKQDQFFRMLKKAGRRGRKRKSCCLSMLGVYLIPVILTAIALSVFVF